MRDVIIKAKIRLVDEEEFFSLWVRRLTKYACARLPPLLLIIDRVFPPL